MSARTTGNRESICVDDLLENEVGELSLGVTVGKNAGNGRLVFQFNEDRYRHMAIIGRTGSGKTNHIHQLEREDIRSGAGCAIIATNEEDALYPLAAVPPERLDDVVLIDAGNEHFLPCMNPLDVDCDDPAAVDKAVERCIALLKAGVYHEFAAERFDHMARVGLRTMLHPRFPDEPSIALLMRLYSDPDYVRECLYACHDEELGTLWQIEGDAHRSSDHLDCIHWFLSKISRFTENRTLGTLFGPGRSTIDMHRIIDNGQILVALIPEERIGHMAASLVKYWLVEELKDAILGRRMTCGRNAEQMFGLFGGDTPESDGPSPFFVYIDEFGEMGSDEFAPLLAQARKYHVGFVFSFQTLSQLHFFDSRTGFVSDNVYAAVLGNAASLIAYPVGSLDGMSLTRYFGTDSYEIAEIARYHPLARLCRDNQQEKPITLTVPLKPEPDDTDMPRRIVLLQIARGTWLPLDNRAKRAVEVIKDHMKRRRSRRA